MDDSLVEELMGLKVNEEETKAKLALANEKIADLEVKKAKYEHSLNLINKELIGSTQKLVKEGKLKNLSTDSIHRLLKYVEELEKDKLEGEMEQQQNFEKMLDSSAENVKGAIKTDEEYVGKLEPQEQPKQLLKQSDKPVVAKVSMRQQIRLAEKAFRRKAKKHGKAKEQANAGC